MRNRLIVLLACGLLTACSDPLRDVPTLSQIDVAEQAGQAEALAAPEESSAEGGFLSSVAHAPAPKAADDAPRRGLMGFFRGRAEAAKADAPAVAATDADKSPAASNVAAAPPAAEPDPAALVEATARSPEARQARGGGFLGGLLGGGGGGAFNAGGSPKPGSPDYEQVGPGVTLPFGQLARLCGMPERSLGTVVARYPERGRGYALYDSKPGSNAAHSWFVTGFDDGCARQFTAALALFGPPESYEQLRYGPAGQTMRASATDAAYESLKSKVCGVRNGQPCGDRIRRLERDTVFVTVYPNFGGSGQWKNLLLHDGALLAADIN